MSDSESSIVGSDDVVFDEELKEELRALNGVDPSKKVDDVDVVGMAEAMDRFRLPHESIAWEELMVLDGTDVHDPSLVDDDLQREYAFYERAMASVVLGEERLIASGTPHIRPDDYFAEMLKSDRHMLKIKAKLLYQRNKLEKSLQAQREREMRKLGKSVQTLRHKEKSEAKNQQEKKLKQWRKRKRGGQEDFDVALLDEQVRLDGKLKRPAAINPKKVAKSKKFGRGGSKDNRNRNTTESAARVPIGDFHKNNRGPFRANKAKKGGAKRPGKDARQKTKGRR